ncbi:MAG: glycosyltransferase family 2 protein [Micrococcaceae bacterium]
MDKILLFIPAYNCEKQIIRVLKQIDKKVLEYISEVIVVNNRSTDNTEAVSRKFSMENPDLNIRILRNRANYNLGGSHKVAFKYAVENNFDYVIVLHGDDQGDIHDLMPVLDKGIYKKYDCCLGARFMKASKLDGYSKFRTFGNYVYNSIFSIATASRIKDLGAGLNMYSTKMLESEFYLKFPDALTFNCFMLFANKTYGFTYYFFPITWREDDQVSNVKMVSQAVTTAKIVADFFVSAKKKFMQKDFRTEVIDSYDASDVTKELK